MATTNRVLIIEDNDDLRENSCEILELAGYQVDQASNGEDGVELAKQYLPDVILCDIAMSGIDGYDTLNLLLQNEHTAHIPFIFLTGKTERVDIRKGMEMGADDYLTKPFDSSDLFNAIECQLRKKRARSLNLSLPADSKNESYVKKSGFEALETLVLEKKPYHLKRKHIVYYSGDLVNGIYKVISGKVKTFKIAKDGREFLTGLFEPGEYFGVTAMFSGKEYHETAETIEDTVLCMVPKTIVEEMINQYQDVSGKFLHLLAGNLVNKDEQLLQLAYHSVRKRMAELLIRLKSKYGTTDLSRLDLSRSNLAGMAGVAMETASRILNDFKQENLIKFTSNNQIIITNCDKLEQMKN